MDDIEYEFVNLNDLSAEINASNSNPEEIREKISKIVRGVKPEKCYYCHEKPNSFCKSHCIPKFCLKSIADNGKLGCFNSIINMPFGKTEEGVNAIETFKMICHKCDSEHFQLYENKDSYLSTKVSNQLLAQIALKNYLKFVHKRLKEKEMYQFGCKQTDFAGICRKQLYGIELDLTEYRVAIQRAKSANKKNVTDAYKMIYYKRLDYVCPVAFQAPVALYFDLNGEMLNEPNSISEHVHMPEIQIAILPIKPYTAVIVFVDSKIKKYNNFIKQFKTLSETEQLAVINKIMLLYSEDYALNLHVAETLKDNKAFKDIVGRNPIFGYEPFMPRQKRIEGQRSQYDLKKFDLLPNLLSEEYALK